MCAHMHAHVSETQPRMESMCLRVFFFSLSLSFFLSLSLSFSVSHDVRVFLHVCLRASKCDRRTAAKQPLRSKAALGTAVDCSGLDEW